MKLLMQNAIFKIQTTKCIEACRKGKVNLRTHLRFMLPKSIFTFNDGMFLNTIQPYLIMTIFIPKMRIFQENSENYFRFRLNLEEILKFIHQYVKNDNDFCNIFHETVTRVKAKRHFQWI